MALKEIKVIIGLAMVGEGIVGFFAPKKYSLFWKLGFESLETLRHKAAENPETMRLIYAAEAGLGYWLAMNQLDRSKEKRKSVA